MTFTLVHPCCALTCSYATRSALLALQLRQHWDAATYSRLTGVNLLSNVGKWLQKYYVNVVLCHVRQMTK